VKASSRLQAIWQQNRSWPIILSVLLLLSIGLFFINQNFVAPGVDALERDYISLQDRSREARKVKAAADSPIAVYQRGIDDLEKFRALIPIRDNFTELVAELFRLAGKANLNISNVNYKPKVLEDYDLLQYGLVFSVNGSYDQLKKFIALIETSERLIAIEGIGLRSDLRSVNMVNLQLQLATYFKADAV